MPGPVGSAFDERERRADHAREEKQRAPEAAAPRDVLLAMQRAAGNQAVARLLTGRGAGRAVSRMTVGGKGAVMDLSSDALIRAHHEAVNESPDVIMSYGEYDELEQAHGALGAAPAAAPAAAAAVKGPSAVAANPLWARELKASALPDAKIEAWGKAFPNLEDVGLVAVTRRLWDAELAGPELEKYVDTLLGTGLTGPKLTVLSFELTQTGLKGAALNDLATRMIAAQIPAAKLADVLVAQMARGIKPETLAADIEGLRTTANLTGQQAGTGLASTLTAQHLQDLRGAGVTEIQIGALTEALGTNVHDAIKDGGWTPAGVKQVLDAGAGVDDVSLARIIRVGADRRGGHFPADKTAAFIRTAKPRCASRAAWTKAVGLLVDFISAGHAQGAGTHGRRGHPPTVLVNHAVAAGSHRRFTGNYNVHTGAPQFAGAAQHHGGYTIRVVLGREGKNHVAEGHTFEGFWFEVGNCHRADPSGGSSMFAPGTDLVTEATNASAAFSLYQDNAAWRERPDKDSDQADIEVAYGGGEAPLPGNVYRIWVEQLYPKGGGVYAKVHGDVMEAIGRLLGHIA